MSRIFLSHSSRNNAEALALRDWLVSLGYDDIFLDLEQIRVGDRWRKALVDSMNRCKLVIFLVSQEWLGSRECFLEFASARDAGKTLFLLIIDETPLEDLPAEYTANYQAVSLKAGSRFTRLTVHPPPDFAAVDVSYSQEGLRSLRLGLAETGLASQATDSFPWPPAGDPERAPFRGLKALDVADAGVFFGRDAQLVRGMDTLQGLREAGGRRLFVILGASGAGKSSYLRAGLWPRLQRDSRHFHPLPVLRPDRGALWGESGLLAILGQALKEAGIPVSRADLRRDIEAGSGGVLARLESIQALVRKGLPDEDRAPTLILPIDQAEELFPGDAALRNEADAFLKILADILAHGPEMIAAATIRSDRYAPLQRSDALEKVPQVPFNLPPMSQADYRAVIEGPARRATEANNPLVIEPVLTERLILDAHGSDALPILSFTLERLFDEHGADGDLRIDEYEALGGIEGSILAAAEAAFSRPREAPVIPDAPAEQNARLKSAFIPHLIDINEENDQPVRRVAPVSEIPEEARPVVERLVNSRLLVSSAHAQTEGGATVEVAHEALIRQWPTLQPWLEEAREALKTKLAVQRAAADWHAGGRRSSDLIHAGERLQAGRALLERPGFAGQMAGLPADYLEAAAAAERKQKARETRRRRLIQSLSTSTIILLAAAVAGTGWFLKETRAEKENAVAARDEAREALMAADEAKRVQARVLMIAKNREDPPIPFDIDVLSKRYEGQSSSNIETDSLGLWYYGVYRIQSGANLQEFLAFLTNHRERFENRDTYIQRLDEAGGLEAGNAGEERFRNAWVQLASGPQTREEFARIQRDFVRTGDYKRLSGKLAQMAGGDFSVSKRSRAFQAVIFSISVQHGPTTTLPENAFSGIDDIGSRPDRELIERLYDERSDIGTYFPEFAQEDLANAIGIRNEWEKRDALYLLENSGD